MATLKGRVEFPRVPHAVRGGTLRVRLVDVSRVDAAARVLAEEVIPGATVQADADRIPFTLDVPNLDPRLRYAVEAHLDADGSGETSPGDYRTMEHFGVAADTVAQELVVTARPVA